MPTALYFSISGFILARNASLLSVVLELLDFIVFETSETEMRVGSSEWRV